MKKKNMWTVSQEDSSVCFQYGYVDEAIFQGNFQYFSGTLLADDRLEALDLMLYVESETIKATESSQNALLLSQTYFDAGEYPVMIFHSGRSPQPDDGRHINLQLTLKGIARPVMLQVLNLAHQAHPTERRVLLVANVIVNASDFEIGVREMHDPDNELLFSVQLVLRRPNSQNKSTAELNVQ
jgi:polyisoprenoid-binding protein YceI